MKIKMKTMALIAMTIGTVAIGETNYDDPQNILAELTALSEECGTMDDGEVKTEVFGIKLVRIDGTCAIVNGSEIDERVRIFLEEQNLPWAGVGLWATAPITSE